MSRSSESSESVHKVAELIQLRIVQMKRQLAIQAALTGVALVCALTGIGFAVAGLYAPLAAELPEAATWIMSGAFLVLAGVIYGIKVWQSR